MQISTVKLKAQCMLMLLFIVNSLSSSAQSNIWVQKNDLGYNVVNAPEPLAKDGVAGFSIGNKGYIGTGFSHPAAYHKDFWEYDQTTNAWSQKADFAGVSRFCAVGFSIGSKGYMGTGYSYSGGSKYYKDFWEYDPVANTWTQKADFGGTGRSNAVGFSIGNKGYLGTGVNYIGGWVYYKDFWEYDPFLNTWMQKANFGGAVRYGAIGYSSDGKGYVGTGYDGAFKKDFWQYDPTVNIWIQKADFGGTARYGAVGFSIENKGYVGTGYDLVTFFKDFWQYDPTANIWIQKTDFGGVARYAAVGFNIGGKGYLGTGANYDGTLDYYKDLWQYDPTANTWEQKTDIGATARSGAVGFNIGNKGYLGTGSSGNSYTKDFWQYDPETNTWTQKADFAGDARTGAVGFSISTKGYLGTGYDGDYKKDFWEYDPDANTWTQKADFDATARNNAVGFSIGNKGYLGTGFDGDYKKDFWRYNPATNSWKKKAAFGGTARMGAVGLSIGSKGYLGTGFKEDTYYKDFWEYDPDADNWTQKADFGGTERSNAVGFSIDNKGYVGTGEYQDAGYLNYKDFWEYNANANIWIQKSDFGGTARSYAVGFSIGSKGYVGTGFFYPEISKKDFWEYTPDTCNGLTVYADTDGDGYGDIFNSFIAWDCVVPSGYVINSIDCDDANANVNPSAIEICFNVIDDDCNGQTDENCICESPVNLSSDDITFSSAQLNWDPIPAALSYKIRHKVKDTEIWINTSSTSNTKSITGLIAETKYLWQVKSKCASNPSIYSEWSDKENFTTAPLKIGHLPSSKISMEIYPNPSFGVVVVHVILQQSSSVNLQISDLNGKEIETVVNQTLDAGDHLFSINSAQFSKGIYLVQMISENGIQNQKLVVQ